MNECHKPDQSKSNDAKNLITIITVIDERERERWKANIKIEISLKNQQKKNL